MDLSTLLWLAPFKPTLVGALTGFITALAVDLHAWADSDADFNWKKAAKRWVAGAIGGATVGAGVSHAS